MMEPQMLKKAERAEFNPELDFKIIEAHLNKTPFVGPGPLLAVPLRRCYFAREGQAVTWLTHLTRREKNLLLKILEAGAAPTHVEYYLLKDNRVETQGMISLSALCHALYHFHHRIGKRYLREDFAAGIIDY